MVTVGTRKVPLPVNNAHPESRPEAPIEVQRSRTRNHVLMCKGEVAKILSFNVQLRYGPVDRPQ